MTALADLHAARLRRLHTEAPDDMRWAREQIAGHGRLLDTRLALDRRFAERGIDPLSTADFYTWAMRVLDETAAA